MTISVEFEVFNQTQVGISVQPVADVETGTSVIDVGAMVYRLPLAPPSTYEGERAAFMAMLPDLGSYQGRFVAVHRGEVVDADKSQRELSKRFFAHHPNAAVYIGFVGPRRIVKIPTPIVRRRSTL